MESTTLAIHQPNPFLTMLKRDCNNELSDFRSENITGNLAERHVTKRLENVVQTVFRTLVLVATVANAILNSIFCPIFNSSNYGWDGFKKDWSAAAASRTTWAADAAARTTWDATWAASGAAGAAEKQWQEDLLLSLIL